MGIRHQHIVDTAKYPNDASDPRVQGEEWNEDHIMPALSADPADPDAGESVIWMSDGTGSGDPGDIMVKINVGGDIRTGTLVDFSSLTPPAASNLLLETGDYLLLESGDKIVLE